MKGADGLYLAVSHTGNDYVVDARLCSCECPDYEYRPPEGGCKHIRRLKLIKGEMELPEEDVLDRIGIGVKDGRTTEDLLASRRADPPVPAKAVADGGIVVADDDGEVLEESEDDARVDNDGRPQDCDCAEFLADADLPCWPCYREGFREPAGDVAEGA